jgi:hypothetical protein
VRKRAQANCVSRLTDITRKLAGKSDGTTLEWLYKKYWLSGIRPQQAIPSTTTINSTPVSTDTNFNGAYLVPDVDSSVFARAFSIAGHDHQQNPAGHYEQEVFVEPTVNTNPNSVQYEIAPSSHPYGLYFGECLVEPPENLSYGAQYSIIKRDRNSSGIAINSEHVQQGPNIPQDHRYQGVGGNGLEEGPKIPQDHHRYIGRMRQPTHSIINNSNNAISMNSPYPQQLCYQGVGGNALGEELTITQHHQYLGGAS